MLPNTCTQAVVRHKLRKLLSLAVLVRNVGMEHAMLDAAEVGMEPRRMLSYYREFL
jgi:hypothetical protein